MEIKRYYTAMGASSSGILMSGIIDYYLSQYEGLEF
jgi:hypothetical protein